MGPRSIHLFLPLPDRSVPLLHFDLLDLFLCKGSHVYNQRGRWRSLQITWSYNHAHIPSDCKMTSSNVCWSSMLRVCHSFIRSRPTSTVIGLFTVRNAYGSLLQTSSLQNIYKHQVYTSTFSYMAHPHQALLAHRCYQTSEVSWKNRSNVREKVRGHDQEKDIF